MLRKIIKIDEQKCNGCGQCIPDCPEGALQVIDGKARLISDLFCDGLGACIKACPQNAMLIEEREAQPYDEFKVMENVVKGGSNVIQAHLHHLKDHGEINYYNQAIAFLQENKIDFTEVTAKSSLPCGCPSSMQRDLSKESYKLSQQHERKVSLNNWPIQLKLLNPNASFFNNADLVIAADCTAFAFSNFHHKFLENKILIMFCPKLDVDLDNYVAKLTEIFKSKEINSITLVHMEVPCCKGIEVVVKKALLDSGQNIIIKDYTVSIQGELT